MLGSSEDNTALSRALSQLAEVEEKIEQLHQEQANNDFFLLAELLSDYIRLLAIVRVSFCSLLSPPLYLICLCFAFPLPKKFSSIIVESRCNFFLLSREKVSCEPKNPF